MRSTTTVRKRSRVKFSNPITSGRGGHSGWAFKRARTAELLPRHQGVARVDRLQLRRRSSENGSRRRYSHHVRDVRAPLAENAHNLRHNSSGHMSRRAWDREAQEINGESEGGSEGGRKWTFNPLLLKKSTGTHTPRAAINFATAVHDATTNR